MAVYTEMKDSGLPWVGNIPSHWRIVKAKQILRNVTIKNHPDAVVLSLYRDWGIVPKASRDDNHNVTSENTDSYKFVEGGDLVINKMKAWQGSLAISSYEGIVSPAYYVCKFTTDAIYRSYFHHLSRSSCYAQEFERLSTGMRVGQWDLGIEDFLSTLFLLPPLEEQKQIATFLDGKCQTIAEIQNDAKECIESYKQMKSSLIFEAVTKGLNPDAEMKDSKVPWIGCIPKDWVCCELKYLTSKIGSGKTPSGGAEVYTDQGVMFLRSQNVYNTGLKIEDVSYITEFIDESMRNTRVQFMDVLLNITGGSIGRCCLYDLPDVRANVNQHVCILRTKVNLLKPEFLRYFLNSAAITAIIQFYQTGGNRAGLNFEQIGKIGIPLPSINEQAEIVSYLDNRCAKIDALILEKEALIKDLEEYKKSLIFECVTGKRKVC